MVRIVEIMPSAGWVISGLVSRGVADAWDPYDWDSDKLFADVSMAYSWMENIAPGQFNWSLEGYDYLGTQAPIPEPATMLLLGSGLVGLAGFRRKIRRS